MLNCILAQNAKLYIRENTKMYTFAKMRKNKTILFYPTAYNDPVHVSVACTKMHIVRTSACAEPYKYMSDYKSLVLHLSKISAYQRF